MYWLSKSIHRLGRFRARAFLFFVVLGPGVITMIADNDAGGISTYAVTGSKYGFNLLWAFFILVPMAYYIQEMTVRLGAVTKRGHAEAIFDGFGPVWGWFSIVDLGIINWLTLITEYIGMTAAMTIFGIPPAITFAGVTVILIAVVISGRYWTFEKITLFFCCFNFVYIPAAFWAMKAGHAPAWGEAFKGFYWPHFPMGLTGDLLFIIMANIGTTITPWQIFFQQSAVVDKGLDIKDIKYGKIDTFMGSFLTCLVAVFIIITTAAALYFHHPPIIVEDAAQTAEAIVPLLPFGKGEWARALFAIGLFDAGFLGALCISLSTSWAVGEVFGWAHSPQQGRQGCSLVLRDVLRDPCLGRRSRTDPPGAAHHHHDVRPGGCSHAAACGASLSHPPAQRQASHGGARQYTMGEYRKLQHHVVCHPHVDALWRFGAFPQPFRAVRGV